MIIQEFYPKTGKNQTITLYFYLLSTDLSEIVKTWPLGFRFSRLQASAVSKNVGGLASRSARADKPRDCASSGWVAQAWEAKLVG